MRENQTAHSVHAIHVACSVVFRAGPEPKPILKGETRTYRVWLDPNQYQKDMTGTIDGQEVGARHTYHYDVAITISATFDGHDLSCVSGRLRDVQHPVFVRQDVYETFNILMRRKPKENNFKAVLETIRDLMNTECVVPDWLHDIILGYGEPGAAHYSK